MKFEKSIFKVGDLIVIWITEMFSNYIGEVLMVNDEGYPLEIKVEENGPYAHLKNGNFIIQEDDSVMIREDDFNDTLDYFLECEKNHIKVISGLKRMGVKDNKLRYLYSSKEARKEQEKYFKEKKKKVEKR
jgi:hypothetical protein